MHHADHLATPRLIADETQKTVWRWDQQEPFGNNPANEDPDGDGIAFELPLRLPGQYYDRESGLHYNYYRDHDPNLGQYVQADPLGIVPTGFAVHRLNHVYQYANASPEALTDRFGLQAEGRRPSVCGADDGKKFPMDFGGWSFETPCRNHDNCYSICRKPKLQCDDEFLGDMLKECNRIPWWMAILARLGKTCRDTAMFYFTAVVARGGDAYNQAQAKCKGC